MIWKKAQSGNKFEISVLGIFSKQNKTVREINLVSLGMDCYVKVRLKAHFVF